MAPKVMAPSTTSDMVDDAGQGAKRPAEGEVEEPAPAKVAKVEEEPIHEEADAAPDDRPRLDVPVGFEPHEMTLNVIPASDGRVLMGLSEGGMAHLVACARGNRGISSGRYFFEVQILETYACPDPSRQHAPKQLVRVGFSVMGSSLFLGETEDGVCFDSDSCAMLGKTRVTGSQAFAKGQVVAVLLNLDQASPNANTVTLYRDGVRVSKPFPLPDALRGKALCPHVSFRAATLQVNFGPEPMAKLPFVCRMLGAAAKDDTTASKAPALTDGKHDVMFPISLPGEGSFDWLDMLLEKNPQFVELSDRKIVDWIAKSGLHRGTTGLTSSIDKPELNLGIRELDDLSARKVIHTVAPLVPRHYVVMEATSNLIKNERTELVQRFGGSNFRRVASVLFGEPEAEYKERVYEELLKIKQAQADAEWMQKKQEAQKAPEVQSKPEETQPGGVAKMETDPPKDEASNGEAKAEVKDELKEEVKKEDVKDEPMDENEKSDTPPKVELTEDDKKQWFKPQAIPDVSEKRLVSCFGDFSIPEASEGFTEIKYEWQEGDKAKEYLRKWVLKKKLATRIEDLQPGEWFNGKTSDWQKLLSEWQRKQQQWKTERDRKAKENKERDAEVERVVVDISSVTDVNDVGNGEPLYSKFAFEDWALLTLRFELALLAKSFKRDVDDADRPGVHESHLQFYYSKYYKKHLSAKFYGVATAAELIELVQDSVSLDTESGIITSPMPDELTLETFVRLTEESRRARQQRIDAGDDTAKLHFSVLAVDTPSGPPGPPNAPSPQITVGPPGGAAQSGTMPGGPMTLPPPPPAWAAQTVPRTVAPPPAGGKPGFGGGWQDTSYMSKSHMDKGKGGGKWGKGGKSGKKDDYGGKGGDYGGKGGDYGGKGGKKGKY